MDSTVLVALIGCLGSLGTMVINLLFSRNSAQKMGLQCLLRAEIIRAHEKYMDMHYCPIYARDSISKAYNAYHALGGNGTITELYKQIMALPTDKED